MKDNPGLFDHARVYIVSRSPFFSRLIMHMREEAVTPAEWRSLIGPGSSPTAAVALVEESGKLVARLFYCPDFISTLSKQERRGVLMHEVLHVVLNHTSPSRIGGRTRGKWLLASDYVVNALVKGECQKVPKEISLPFGALYDAAYSEMSVEEVYNLLPDPEPQPQKGGGQSGDGSGEGGGAASGSGEGTGSDPRCCGGYRILVTKDRNESGGSDGVPTAKQLTPAESLDMSRLNSAIGEFEEEQKNRLVQAYQFSKLAGNVPGGMDRLVDDVLNPKVHWQVLLERYASEILREDYDSRHFDRRFMGGIVTIDENGETSLSDPVYFPDLLNEATMPIVAVDVSGSISQDMMKKFVGEVAGMLRSRAVSRLRLLVHDTKITLDTMLDPTDPVPESFPGGGGTDFRPLFERIEEEGIRPSVFIHLTDLEGPFPEVAPNYPCIFVASETYSTKEAPFGFTIKYDEI